MIKLNKKKKLKDNLTNILEKLSNDKIEDFKKVISGADPYNLLIMYCNLSLIR